MFPTNKYIIFIMIFLGYAAYNYNRKAVSYSVTSLIADGMSGDEVGLILSSQNIAYTVSKFFGGIIFDSISARYLFAGGLILSGISAIAFASSNLVYVFAATWFVNGLAQGLGWPAIARLLNKWFEPHEFGTFWSLASTSANAIGTIGPIVAGFILSMYGWRSSVMFAGAVSIFMASVCLLLIKDSPPPASDSKKTAKDFETKPKAVPKNLFDSFWTLLKSKPVIFISIQYFTVSGLKTCISDWGILYLTETSKLGKNTADVFLSSFEFGGIVGGIFSGLITDFIIRSYYKNKLPEAGNPRMGTAAIFNAISILAFYIFRQILSKNSSYFVVTSTGLVLGALVYGQITIYGLVASSAISKEKGGTAHAIVGLAANVGSVFAGLPFAYFASQIGWKEMCFVYNSVMIATLALQILMANIVYQVKLHAD